MVLFCTNCNNLLYVNTASNILEFQCKSCLIKYESNPEDSLRFEDTKNSNILIFSKILKRANLDPVNPKKKVKCNRCSYDTVKQVRLGDDMRLINTCIKCNFQWLDI